jgi:UDP-N-acetylmuramoylalanine--D-glutamate ligase
MTDIIVTNRTTAIVGMGVTGLSVAQFLSSQGIPFTFIDSRFEPPYLDRVKVAYPDVKVVLGPFENDFLATFDRLIVSPGIPLSDPALVNAKERGVELIGDLELFLQHAKAPVIAITGSNGKSTVTTLLGQMAIDTGLNVGIGGNLGVPMLDLLDDSRQLYVLELSSFQLELLNDSRGAIVALLNISSDHLDRYVGLQDYHAAKHRIFRGASKVIVNRDDKLTKPLMTTQMTLVNFGLGQPDLGDFGIVEGLDQGYLAYGIERLLPVSELSLKGKHNIANALAALALGYCADLPMSSMLETLKTFTGLPHRCQTIAEVDGVYYIDDSKATNVGATVAALEGLGSKDNKNLILIAGGQGKGQDFSDLREQISHFVKMTVLIGEDGYQIERLLKNENEYRAVDSLHNAVLEAKNAATQGDIILLSPACASFDMFDGFEHRGQCFQEIVLTLLKDHYEGLQ